MLSKLKQFKDLRAQGKKIQNALSDESTTVNEGGVVMTMNGNLEMDGLAIDDDLLSPSKKEKLQNSIKSAHKTAMRKMQRVMASKMKEMGGLDLPGLK
ncbi:MAG: YbaB/EbfC family nucleoid-associated protein [bacterium]